MSVEVAAWEGGGGREGGAEGEAQRVGLAGGCCGILRRVCCERASTKRPKGKKPVPSRQVLCWNAAEKGEVRSLKYETARGDGRWSGGALRPAARPDP